MSETLDSHNDTWVSEMLVMYKQISDSCSLGWGLGWGGMSSLLLLLLLLLLAFNIYRQFLKYPLLHSQPNKSNLNLLNGPPTPKKRLEASSLVPTGTPWWLNPAVSRGYHWDEDLCGASWWTRRSQGGIAKRPARSIKIWEKWLGLRDI